MKLPIAPANWSADWQGRFIQVLESILLRKRDDADIELRRETVGGATRDQRLYLWGPDDLRYELRDYLRLRAKDVTGTTYTPAVGDENYVLTTTNGSAVTVSLPKNATAAFPVKSVIHFYQEGAGTVTLQAEDGTVTVRSRPGLVSAGQYAMFSAWKRDTNLWVAFGDLTTA